MLANKAKASDAHWHKSRDTSDETLQLFNKRLSLERAHDLLTLLAQRNFHDSLIFTITHPFDQAALFKPLDDVGDSRCINSKPLGERAVEQVHHTPTFREHVHAMQQTVRVAGGYQRAVDAISNFARHQK